MTLQVEGTNDSSCLSKCSAAKSGYFNDDFLTHFVKKCPRRAPLIHLGYSVRVAIINSLVDKFVRFNIGGDVMQIVSIGAGFDTLFFKLRKNCPGTNINYFELDLPRVVQRKIKSIQQSNILKEIIGDFTVNEDGLISKYYKLLSVDLRNIKAVKDLFQRRGLNVDVPTLFLSECVITYLEEDRSSQFIRFASEFKHATFITYEQIQPDDKFGQVMLDHFASLQSPLLSVEKYPTLEHQIQRYIDNSWENCTSLSALDCYFQLVSEEERKRVLLLEPFDEWEEFYLKCVHYTVVIASKGSLHDWSKLRRKCSLPSGVNLQRDLKFEMVRVENVSRYGHIAVQCRDYLLLIGGFGARKNGRHGRLKDVTWMKFNEEESTWSVFRVTEDVDCASMYSTWTPVTETSYIVYGGRTSPVQCTNVTPSLVTVNATDGCVNLKPLVKEFDKSPRWRHSGVVAKWNNNQTFVVFGGRTCDFKILDDLWMLPLDREDPKVVTLPYLSDQPSARFSHSAAVRQTSSGSDEIWLSGGLGEDGLLGDLWCLDLDTLTWRSISVTLLPRAGHSSSVFTHRLILVGGFGSIDHCQPGVSVVDLNSGSCFEYQLPGLSPEKSLLLINHCHVVFEDQETLWIVGGGGNCFSFGTFFNSHLCAIKLKDLVCK